MANRLATTAAVVALATPDATWGLNSEFGGKELSAWHGALRVYLPGLTRTSDPTLHPLVRAGRLADLKEQHRIAKWLAARTVVRFRDDARRLSWRDRIALANTERRTARERQLEDAVRRAAEAQDDAEQARLFAEENRQLHADLASRDAHISALEAQLAAAENEVRGLRYARGQRGASADEVEAAAGPQIPVLGPADVEEAVLIAEQQFGPHLRFLPSAHVSAAESDFSRPEDILETLGRLAGLAKRAASASGLGKSLLLACRAEGLDYAPRLARTTSKRIRKQYRFLDGDHEVTCEEHIRLGGGGDSKMNARIYFSADQLNDGEIVIGHVGRHLDVITTN